MRVLLIEDERSIASVIRRGLEEEQCLVDVRHDGPSGLEAALSQEYGVIILDLMLPGMDGLTVCKRLRHERVATPLLMLTARDAVPDRVRGLETGADDYLTKPFDFSELLARVRALARRDKLLKGRSIRIADLEIDTVARRVARAGQEIFLTPREYTLLEALATNEGRVLTREIIQDQIWMNEDSYSNTVDVHIGLLRRKIDTGYPTRLIQTVHGMGYTLRPSTKR